MTAGPKLFFTENELNELKRLERPLADVTTSL